VTREFIKQLVKARPAQATIVRTYASVRHFARWIHEKVAPFPLGCPTDGIKPPQGPETEWKGLSRAEDLRLLNATQPPPIPVALSEPQLRDLVVHPHELGTYDQIHTEHSDDDTDKS
jgi:site-specific recombinase XerC